jgi:hypothetical protein
MTLLNIFVALSARVPILTVPQPSDVVGVADKGAVQHGPRASFGSIETGVR